jgi:hypothetical protein
MVVFFVFVFLFFIFVLLVLDEILKRRITTFQIVLIQAYYVETFHLANKAATTNNVRLNSSVG